MRRLCLAILVLSLAGCVASASDDLDTSQSGLTGGVLIALLSPRVSVTATVVPITPNAIANLLLWMKADAITGLADGQTVTTWLDSSGAGHIFTPINTPLYRTNVRNGLPALSFQQADAEYMRRAYTAALNPAEFTVAYVAATTGAAGTYRSAVTNRSNSGLTGFFSYADANDRWSGTVGNTNWNVLNARTIVFDEWKIITLTMSGDRQILYDMGERYGLKIITSYQPNGTDQFLIGAGNNGTDYYFEGYIAEVVYIGRGLSDTERAGLECYLSKRYAISIVWNCGG